MSTITWNDVKSEDSSPNLVKIIIPIGVICALFLGFVLYFMNLQTMKTIPANSYVISGNYDLTPAQIRIIEVVSGHAWESHGLNASKALDCLGRLGSKKSLKTTGFADTKTNKPIPTFAWLCQDIDNSWYAIITTEFIQDISKNNVARLITAYKISRDLFPEIGDYLMYLGEKWGASYISKIIGAGQIYIQPK